MKDREWTSRAACRNADPGMFTPDIQPTTLGPTGQRYRIAAQDAILICNTCPVVPDCLIYAIHNNETAGIWGGMPPVERARLKHLIREYVRSLNRRI